MEIINENQDKFCRVEGCRFAWSHVTSSHLCPCGEHGHGQIECGNPNKINLLANFYNEILSQHKHCTFNNCHNKETHTKEAHHCEKCGKRNHSSSDCIIQPIDNHINKYGEYGSINLRMFDYHNFFRNFNNVYLDEYAGMGCTLFIRKKNNKVESLFMHNDAWGQYNEDDRPIYNKFIQGCGNITDIYRNRIAEQDQDDRDDMDTMDNMDTLNIMDAMDIMDNMVIVDNTPEIIPDIDYQENPHMLYPEAANGGNINDNINDNINETKCPVCRTPVKTEKIREIKGSSDECKVCWDKNVELYFEECAHACICKDCFTTLQEV